MKKSSAFSLAEIVIAMIIVMVISAFMMPYFKSDNKKLKMYAYTTVMNLQKGNSAVMSKYASMIPATANSSSCPPNKYSVGCKSCNSVQCTQCQEGFKLVQDSSGGTIKNVCQFTITETVDYIGIPQGYDGYCLRLADNFSLKEAAKCETKPAGDSTANLVFLNNTTIQGLSTPWILPYPGADYYFKNIVIDIDGDKGANKVWVDRVPMRIYAGNELNGTVLPVSCVQSSGDFTYNGTTKVIFDDSKRNLYCKQGWDASGAYANKNFLLDDKVNAYNVYRLQSSDENAVAEIVSESVSIMKASCSGYGATGVYSKEICSSFDDNVEDAANKKGIRIHPKCITNKECYNCWKDSANNMCPRNDDGADVANYEECKKIRDKYNPEDINCFMLPHKPSVGAGFIFNGMLDNLDM